MKLPCACRLSILAAVVGAALSIVYDPSIAGAQTASVSVGFGKPERCKKSFSPDALAKTYYSGDWEKAQSAFGDSLAVCLSADQFNLEDKYYLVILPTTVGSTAAASSDPSSPQTQLVHFLVHKGLADYKSVLPGLSRAPVCDSKSAFQVVYLSKSESDDIRMTVAEARVNNGLSANAGAFFQQLSGTLVPVLPRSQPRQFVGAADTAAVYWRQGCVPILYDNASLSVADVVTLSDAKADAEAIVKAVTKAHVKWAAYTAGHRDCASDLNDSLSTFLIGQLSSSIPEDLSSRLLNRMATAARARCAGTDPANGIETTVAQAMASDYLNAIKRADPQPVTGTSSVANAPLVHFRFTAVVGGLVGRAYGGEPLSVNSTNNTYQLSPLARGFTMAGLSIAPFAFDSTTADMTWRERVNLLVGATLTPSGGVGTGVSIPLLRGFAINGGYAWFLTNRPPSGLGLGSGSAVPATGRQLKTGITNSFFVGGNYTFSK